MRILSAYLAAWVGMAVLAILNGILREKSYGRFLGDLAAHQVSTFLAITLFGGYVWAFTGWVPIESAMQAAQIGTLWLAMTVLFEFGFGHFAAGHSWAELLHDYNLFKGRLWVLVLIWIALAPYVCFRLRS